MRFLGPVAFLAALSSYVLAQKQCAITKYQNKTRVFVSTDIGNEPDDQMSLVRFLTYSNEFTVEGLSASTSVHIKSTKLDQIYTVVDAYAKVISNLNAHVPVEGAYPTVEYLKSVTSVSKSVYGLEALKDPKLSTAADAFIKAVDKSPKPIWFLAWGGTLVLAESLNNIRNTRSAPELAKFVEKVRLYTISDQDDSGQWIRTNFPKLFSITSVHAMTVYNLAAWTGISGEHMYFFDDGGPDSSLVTNEWLAANIKIGPLGAAYPRYPFIMEGDTPSFLYLIPNGLGNPENPRTGSWGGRYGLVDPSGSTGHWSDYAEKVTGVSGKNYTSNHATVWRWRKAYQYDFAARMNHSVAADYKLANHAPVAVVNGTCGPGFFEAKIQINGTVVIDASASFDPDNDKLSFDWQWDPYQDWSQTRYVRNLARPSQVTIKKLNADGSVVSLVPNFASGSDIHVILTVSDKRDKELVAYRRVVLKKI